MRQTHVAGEKLFVDCAGATADVIDVETRAAIVVRRSRDQVAIGIVDPPKMRVAQCAVARGRPLQIEADRSCPPPGSPQSKPVPVPIEPDLAVAEPHP